MTRISWKPTRRGPLATGFGSARSPPGRLRSTRRPASVVSGRSPRMSPRAEVPPPPGRILISEEELQARIGELGGAIARDYERQSPVVVGVLQGAFLFMADLIRAIPIDLMTDFIGVSSYGSGTRSSGAVRLVPDLSMSIEDRHVLIVEDIVDTGLTLSYLNRTLEASHPPSALAI